MNPLRATLDLLARRQPAAMDAWAIARVQAMGKLVVDADATVLANGPHPWAWERWTPTRTAAPCRMVVGGNRLTGMVLYTLSGDDRDECTLATWHRWVRRTRAVRS